jgi:hypothetical protein
VRLGEWVPFTGALMVAVLLLVTFREKAVVDA